jgi:hydrogenase nickel incorporation protein HypA/HybF
MHELAVCQGLIREVEAVARAHEAQSVVCITVCVGPLSGIEPQLLESAFPLASAGTRIAQARLVIESTPVKVRCPRCARESQVPSARLLCAHCGEWRVELVSGAELLLTRVELTRSRDA